MKPGLSASRRHEVGDADSAIALGSGDLAVLATPRLVAWLEGAAVAAVAPALEPGTTTVGGHISLDHIAPSALGAIVEVSARLTEVRGRRLDFTITATDGGAQIANGHHVRYVVDRAEFLRRATGSG